MAFVLLFGGGLLLVSSESEIIKTDGNLGLGVILGFSCCLFVSSLQDARQGKNFHWSFSQCAH